MVRTADYKKKFANDEIYDNVLQPNKFPLHKALEGHKVGDTELIEKIIKDTFDED